jgi:hypothetical protein
MRVSFTAYPAMSVANGWTRQRVVIVLGVLMPVACAVQTMGTGESEIVGPSEGVGGDVAGMTASGGTSGASTGAGGTTGGTDGTGGTTSTGGATSTGGTTSTGGATSTGGTGGTTSTGGASGASTTGGTTMGGRGGTATGAAGRSSSAGMTSQGGRTASGGTSAGGRASGAGGMNGGGTEADGCAKLSVPLNGSMDKAHFVISLRSAANLGAAGTTISMRIYVEAGIGGVIFPYAQDDSFNFLGPAMRPALADQDGWVTLNWNIAAEPNGTPALMKSSVSRIGIEIKAAPSAMWSNPTVVYVDSISVDSADLSFPFNTTGTVSTSTTQTADQTGQVLWLNSGDEDTTASGSRLSWVATCP